MASDTAHARGDIGAVSKLERRKAGIGGTTLCQPCLFCVKEIQDMIIRIYSDITDNESVRYGCAGCSYENIADALAAMPEDDDTIDLRIDCRGGLISAGWAIVDALRATGKTIKATIEGYCGSMAIAILLAASDRTGARHALLHAHRACFPPYTLADSYNDRDLEKLAEDLRTENNRLLDFYVERTGSDRATLEALMDEDKDIDMERALELGFIHRIAEPMSASTAKKRWLKQETPKSNNMAKNAFIEAFRAFAAALGQKVNITEEDDKQNYVLVAADGTELNINKPEGEEIAVGDAATPDGEYVLEDGRKVKIEGGVITEIESADTDDPENKKRKCNLTDEEAAQLQQENADLKAEVERLQAELEEAKKAAEQAAENKEILEIVNKAGGRAWLDKVSASGYKPKVAPKPNNNVQKLTKMQKRIAELQGKSEE